MTLCLSKHNRMAIGFFSMALFWVSSAWAANSAPASCSDSQFINASNESGCAENSGTFAEQCDAQLNQCMAQNPTKKSSCNSVVKACASGVLALKNEAIQCRWRKRMSYVFSNNSNDDSVKVPCRKAIANKRIADRNAAKQAYSTYQATVKSRTSQ